MTGDLARTGRLSGLTDGHITVQMVSACDHCASGCYLRGLGGKTLDLAIPRGYSTLTSGRIGAPISVLVSRRALTGLSARLFAPTIAVLLGLGLLADSSIALDFGTQETGRWLLPVGILGVAASLWLSARLARDGERSLDLRIYPGLPAQRAIRQPGNEALEQPTTSVVSQALS